MIFSIRDQLKSVLPHDRYDTFSHSCESRKAGNTRVAHSQVQEMQDHSATTETHSTGRQHVDLDKCIILHTG